jgi:hypothetical protein
MVNRRGIGRTEIIAGVAVVAVLALITVPLWTGTSKKTARAEVPLNVDSIRTAEITWHGSFDDYVSATDAPRAMTAVNDQAVAWAPSKGFEELRWSPADAQVYGSYKVVASDKGFTVTGACDVDADGARAVYTATQDEGAKATTDESIY